MFIPLTYDTAQARHPEEVEAACQKILASKSKAPIDPDPATWSWGYDYAQRVEAMSFHEMISKMGQEPEPKKKLVGRALLEAKPNDYFISLDAKAGRRGAAISLDNQKLLAGPDSSLPLEVLGVHARPEGASAWVWYKPGKNEEAAWFEGVVIRAVEIKNQPATWVVEVKMPDLHTLTCLMDVATGKGRQVSDWDGVLTQRQAVAVNKALEGGPIPKDMREVSAQELMQTFGQHHGVIALDARFPTIAELLGALQGPGFMAFGEAPEDKEDPAPQSGPWVAWDGARQDRAPAIGRSLGWG